MRLKHLIALFAVASALAGCQEATEYTPSLYLTEAQVDNTKTITILAAGQKATLSVTASSIVDQATTVTVGVHPELLDNFNKKYGKTCVLLDPSSYEFAKKEVTIKAGFNVSDEAEIKITKDIEAGTFYCLPVSISSTNSNLAVLEPSRTLYMIFRSPVKSKGVYLGGSNKYVIPGFNTEHGKPGARDLSALPEMTLECRVFVNKFKTNSPYISSVMGLEGECCIRYGDVKIGYDVIQVCKGDYQPAAISAPSSTGRWYHVAGVWSRTKLSIYIDGKFITETKHQGETLNITRVDRNPGIVGFALGAASVYESMRPLDGYLAEARVWTRALSGSEIANIKDLVIVDPHSPNLLAYWKMNETVPTSEQIPPFSGSWTFRNKVIDQTGNGYDAYGQGSAPAFLEATW